MTLCHGMFGQLGDAEMLISVPSEAAQELSEALSIIMWSQISNMIQTI